MLDRWTNFLVVATLMVLVSSALMVGSAREGTDNNGYVLKISVMDATTGSSVKALMTVYYGNDVAAKLETDENGLARAELPAGNYTYSVEARGYQPVKGRFFIVDSSVALTISMEPVPNDVSVGVLKSHLVDVVKNIPVHGVMTIYGPEGWSATFKSDERGFIKAELPFGEYKYSVEARGYEPVRGAFDLKEQVLEMRVPMKPASGGEDPEPEQYGVISGTVLGPRKEPVIGAKVLIKSWPRLMLSEEPSIYNPGVNSGNDAEGKYPPIDENNVFNERTATDREGHFKFRVPYGAYDLTVEAAGYLPFCTAVLVPMAESEVRVPIMLQRMPDEPPFPDMRRAVIDLSYGDRNSDGMPEKFHLVMDIDGDRVPELEFSMVDRNSDGNPEELNVHSSLPPSMRGKLMDLIMMLIRDPSAFPFPENQGDTDNWRDGEGNRAEPSSGADWGEIIRKLIEGGDIEGGSEQPDERAETLDEKEGGSVSEKKGESNNGPNHLIAFGAMIALFLMILLVLSFGILLRTGRNG